jgi:hypothetical protein
LVTNIYSWYRNDTPIMVLNMPFDTNESSAAKDYSGLGNDGAAEGVNWTSSGKVGGAYDFTQSSGSYINLTNPESLNFTTQNFSVSMWLKTSNFTDTYYILKKGATSASDPGYMIRTLAGQTIEAVIGNGSSTENVTSGALNNETWYHLLLSVDRSDAMKIYINGELNASADISAFTNDIGSTNDLYIGDKGSAYNGTIDDVRIYNMSLTPEQIWQIYLDNKDGKSDSSTIVSQETSIDDQWICGVTPTDAVTDGSALNSTALEILAPETNTAPNTLAVVLNATSEDNYTTDDLLCWAKPYDEEDATLTAWWRWYNGTTDYINGSTASVSNDTLTLVSTLESGNTSKGEVWNCSVFFGDSIANESDSNNATITIRNTPPGQVTLSEPPDGSHTTERTPMFSWVALSDDDGDALNYTVHINGSDYSDDDRSVVVVDTDSCSGDGFCNYTPTTELKYFGDDGYYYNWSVRAFDGEDYGAWSSEWNVTIDTNVSITLYNDTVSFGTIYIMEANDTTDDEPGPFRIRNDGNCFIDINISLTDDLWGSVSSPSQYFRYQIGNVSGEEGSLNWSSANTTFPWVNVPLVNESAIAYLNWSDSMDEAEIDLRIQVPPDESPGSKDATIVFTGGYFMGS